jgi:hypothetical protein
MMIVWIVDTIFFFIFNDVRIILQEKIGLTPKQWNLFEDQSKGTVLRFQLINLELLENTNHDPPRGTYITYKYLNLPPIQQ